MMHARRELATHIQAVALLVGWVALAATSCATGGPTASPSPFNVVLVLVDDLGWRDLGCQGSDLYETPRIDALAAEGVRFTQAYSNCPVCSPSRAALLTGQYPGRVGFTGHITAIGRHRHPDDSTILPPEDFMYLRHEFVTIAEALKTVGYVSASIGKWHLGSEPYWPLSQGFDLNVAGHTHGSPASYFFPYRKPDQAWNPDMPNLDLSDSSEGEYLTDRLTDEALEFIERNSDRPFFLYLSHYAVHTPLQAPEQLVRKYQRKIAASKSGIGNPVYAAMVDSVDASVGRILDGLNATGVADRTVVILGVRQRWPGFCHLERPAPRRQRPSLRGRNSRAADRALARTQRYGQHRDHARYERGSLSVDCRDRRARAEQLCPVGRSEPQPSDPRRRVGTPRLGLVLPALQPAGPSARRGNPFGRLQVAGVLRPSTR